MSHSGPCVLVMPGAWMLWNGSSDTPGSDRCAGACVCAKAIWQLKDGKCQTAYLLGSLRDFIISCMAPDAVL